jgi:2,3-bisphosphoglycerate-independent phosphoglycerate mutase
MHQPKVILIILDGWGYSPIRKGNAITQAKTPHFDRLWESYPHTLLSAAGESVGLPWGEIGSSEVGHTCLGSGRLIYQDLPRILKAIASGEFYENKIFLEALNHAKKNKSSLHLFGLISAGGVHSHIDHLFALLKLIKKQNFTGPSFIHMVTDGRDTPPKTAQLYLNKVEQFIKALHVKTKIATVIGRYYAMDRDSHWERTFAAYNALVNGQGEQANSATEAILNAYARGETDEFIKPTVILSHKEISRGFLANLFKKAAQKEEKGPTGLIQNNDAIIFFNFRPERMRQLLETFLLPQANFPAKKLLQNLYLATMVEYEPNLPLHVAFPIEKIENPLAKILSDHHIRQLHIAETEKYAHATYYFNGGHPKPYKNEDWVIIPSPRVPTYDLKPEMSAPKITDKIFQLLKTEKYDFILVNFANADMVGHTGKLKAGIRAIEAIDKQLGRLTHKLPDTAFLITADHGNAEEMRNPETNEINTAHSIRPVPFILAVPKYKKKQPPTEPNPTGILADVAPTVLSLLNIEIPKEMTGVNLCPRGY